MTVRLAQRKDRDRVVELGKLMHKESPVYSKYPYDDEKVRSWIEEHGVNPSKLFLVSEVNDEIVGFFFARMGTHFFSPEKMAIDECLYLHPDHRGGREVFRMFHEYENWGRFHGAKVINFSQTVLGFDERWVKFCKKLGFHLTGSSFKKEI
jgi:hypothetical protein